MTAAALRSIEQDLRNLVALAGEADAEPIDPFDLLHIARKIGAQAEMLEQGIGE